MHTELCDRLGIEFPIFAFTHCRDVVVAVSRNGGFGVLGAVGFSPEQLEVELKWIDEHIGDKPYGVDIVIPGKYEGMGEMDPAKLEATLLAAIPEQNRQFAAKLLADAGVPNGFSCSLLSTAQYGMHKDTAEVVQQHLAAVGIKVELNMPDWATRVALGNKGQYDLAVMGTAADSNDPDGIASFIDGSLSPSYARSVNLPTPKITELLAKGRAEFDAAKRRDIYREVERLAIDEAPIVGLTWRSQGYGMRRQVTGFKNMPGALTFYSGMTFETTDVS